MSHSIAYALYPECVLSFSSRVFFDRQKVSQNCFQALALLQQSADELHEKFSSEIITAGHKAELCSLLAQNVRSCLCLIEQPFLHPLSRKENDERVEDYFLSLPLQHSPRKLLEYKVYDSFFRQYRVLRQNTMDFLLQFLTLWYYLLVDLPYLELPGHELSHLFRLLAAVLESSLHGLDISLEPENKSVKHLPSITPEAFNQFWQSQHVSTEQVKVKIAFYRWFCGHQLWNLSLNFLTAYMQALASDISTTALPQNELLIRVERLSHMMRGGTSLLWYTMAFPSYLYQKHISVAMEKHSQINGSRGLSGGTGQDYLNYVAELKSLYSAIHQCVEVNKDESLKASVQLLQHQEILFQEHHIVLANEKVGLAYYSILQRLSGNSERSGVSPAISGMRERLIAKQTAYKKKMAPKPL
jgi:hypothetical protein